MFPIEEGTSARRSAALEASTAENGAEDPAQPLVHSSTVGDWLLFARVFGHLPARLVAATLRIRPDLPVSKLPARSPLSFEPTVASVRGVCASRSPKKRRDFARGL